MKVRTLRLSVILLAVVLVGLVGVAVWLSLPPETPPGGWQEDAAGRFYLTDQGNRLYGWQEIDEGTYYFDESGYMATGWLDVTGEKYFLAEDGKCVTGLWNCPQGSYYFGEDGAMVTGWADTPDGKRYFGSDGLMTVGFLELDGNRYCFNQGGVMCTGWQDMQDGRLYFDETGVMVTGWMTTEDGTWYLQEDGHPYTGWMMEDNLRRYFLSDGAMATGLVEVDGIQRYFSSDGNYIPLVNPWNQVPEDYQLRLVTVEDHQVDFTCADALLKMVKAARADGLTCILNSTYRDMATQTYLWNRRYNDYLSQGYSEEEAYRLSARRVAYPGTSEHHTGLAIDIKGSEELYQWFRDHAWEYGFHVRYRGDKESLTGIKDEPWHLRYLGKEFAQILQEKDLCVEEYLNAQTT